jgi:hypothetical protein
VILFASFELGGYFRERCSNGYGHVHVLRLRVVDRAGVMSPLAGLEFALHGYLRPQRRQKLFVRHVELRRRRERADFRDGGAAQLGRLGVVRWFRLRMFEWCVGFLERAVVTADALEVFVLRRRQLPARRFRALSTRRQPDNGERDDGTGQRHLAHHRTKATPTGGVAVMGDGPTLLLLSERLQPILHATFAA